MAPTKVYAQVPDWLSALEVENCSALANITGGGISGNLPRVLPKNVKAVIEKAALPTQVWMADFIRNAGVSFEEAEPVFNLGAGMIAVVSASKFDRAFHLADEMGLEPVLVGDLEAHSGAPIVEYR